MAITSNPAISRPLVTYLSHLVNFPTWFVILDGTAHIIFPHDSGQTPVSHPFPTLSRILRPRYHVSGPQRAQRALRVSN